MTDEGDTTMGATLRKLDSADVIPYLADLMVADWGFAPNKYVVVDEDGDVRIVGGTGYVPAGGGGVTPYSAIELLCDPGKTREKQLEAAKMIAEGLRRQLDESEYWSSL